MTYQVELKTGAIETVVADDYRSDKPEDPSRMTSSPFTKFFKVEYDADIHQLKQHEVAAFATDVIVSIRPV